MPGKRKHRAIGIYRLGFMVVPAKIAPSIVGPGARVCRVLAHFARMYIEAKCPVRISLLAAIARKLFSIMTCITVTSQTGMTIACRSTRRYGRLAVSANKHCTGSYPNAPQFIIC